MILRRADSLSLSRTSRNRIFAPAWALEGVKTEPFATQYGPGKGTVLSLPMPWDSVYLNRWFAFLKQVSDRYGKSRAFRLVGAAGPTSVSVEMTLPRDPKKWQDAFYTPRKYIEAYQKVFQVYATDFPNQYISLAVGDSGPENQEPATSFVMSYGGRIITGLQTRCAAKLGTCSAAMGAEGDPPLALRKSIDKGMRPNSVGRHINYLEIYEPDVLADEMQPVLRYGASLFARRQP